MMQSLREVDEEVDAVRRRDIKLMRKGVECVK
jgi:hypothetical protein